MSISDDNNSTKSLEWASTESKQQTLHIQPTNWDYKVFPYMSQQDHLYEGDFGDVMFQFEGVARINQNTRLSVVGTIETLEPKQEIGKLRDHWNNVPENYQGYAFLWNEDNSISQAFIGLTLLCRSSAIEHLYKAFMVGFSTPNGGLGIEVNLTYPDEISSDFWASEWQSKWLSVTGWDVYSGSSRELETFD